MLASSKTEEFLDSVEKSRDWIVARKWDGWSFFWVINNSGNKLLSRAGHNIIRNTPQFQVSIPVLHGTILVCEGITRDESVETATRIFNSNPDVAFSLQKLHGNIKLILHDCIQFKGKKIKSLSRRERRKYLELAHSLLKIRFPIKLEKYTYRNKRRFYHSTIKKGGEGVMVKNLNSSYKPGKRDPSLLKIKPIDSYDYVIVGFTKGKGKGKFSNLIGAVEYGGFEDGQYIKIGTASGMNLAVREDMTRNPSKYLYKVAEFNSTGLTKYGVMRHPRYIKLRPDKRPSECIL